MDLGIRGKTAFVSGASRGIGRAVAEALGSAGVRVAVNYLRNADLARTVAATIEKNGGRAAALGGDVSNETEAARLIEEAEAALGPIDILVNNVHGVITRRGINASDWVEHTRHAEGILKPAVVLTRLVLPGMRKRGSGRIINMGSRIVEDTVNGYSAYTSAMASLLGFTRNLAREAGPWGVTVNMVSPGFVVTEKMPNTTEAVRRALAETTSLGRLALPEDIAGPVLFFCSDLARFVTGVNLPVDGGKAMG